jgi:acyl-CoA dehydrogenase
VTSKILSRRDLDFLLFEWLGVERLVARPRFAEHGRGTFEAALDAAEVLATSRFADHNRLNDEHEPTFDGERVTLRPEVKRALDAFAEAGWMAAGQDTELGGMQLPCVVEKACFAWFLGANVATSAYPLLTIGNAGLLLARGTQAQIEAFAKPELAGRFLGTMCLSEPQAGSSLADLRTRAEPDGDSPLGPRHRLFGSKMWISGGDHELSENIVHLVLARIAGAPPGVKGISLFAVPKYLVGQDGVIGERNDVALAGLNHKMGYRGTVNTLLSFGEGAHQPEGKPGAIGYLIGQPHRGLAAMFHMMNEARIGVGLGAVALGYSGYLHSLAYARERTQGRPVTSKDPSTEPVAIIEHPDVRRMLLAQKAYVEGGLALGLYCAELVDEQRTAPTPTEREEATILLDLLTPIAKSWPSQWCLEASSLAIQVLGGYGYTRDYPVEQLYRDNRLNPIHEGTHGIQALDLFGRRVVAQGGRPLMMLRERIARTVAEAEGSGDAELARFGAELIGWVDRIGGVTAQLFAQGDVTLALANATVYLEAFGHLVVGWLWLSQAVTVHARAATAPEGSSDAAFYAGKRQACRFFFRWELPKLGPGLELLASLDRTTLDMNEAWF